MLDRYRELEPTWREVTRLLGVTKPADVVAAVRKLVEEHRRLVKR